MFFSLNNYIYVQEYMYKYICKQGLASRKTGVTVSGVAVTRVRSAGGAGKVSGKRENQTKMSVCCYKMLTDVD